MISHIFNILLFIISQLAFTNNLSTEPISSSDHHPVVSKDLSFFCLGTDEYIDMVDDETSKHLILASVTSEISQNFQNILSHIHTDVLSAEIKLLNKYIDLPPPSIS